MGTILDALDSGAHVVASDNLYGGTFRLFERVRRRSANLELQLRGFNDLRASLETTLHEI